MWAGRFLGPIYGGPLRFSVPWMPHLSHIPASSLAVKASAGGFAFVAFIKAVRTPSLAG
jgi:hypothetical protein